MRKLVLATKNLGKVAEFQRLLSEHASGIKVLGLADFPNMPEVIESGKTLSQNAFLKAKMISAFTNLPTLSDDSGLFIDALAGDPGIYSARWAQYQGSDSKEQDLLNISKVLTQLKEVRSDKRSAQFMAAVVFYKAGADHLPLERVEIGVLAGEIISAPLGSGGFGYDPIFMPTGYNQTLAQLSPVIKDQISHRGIALRAIAPFILDHL
jgi:XTP/dITP diphosphohydrolase